MIKIKIPKKIKIGGYDYKITIGERTDRELECARLWGQTRTRLANEIVVASILGEQRLSECLIHELLHAIEGVYLSGETDEHLIKALAEGLFQVLEQMGIRFVRRVK